MFDKDYYKGDYNYIAYCKYHFEEVNNTDLYPEKIFLFLQHVNNIHWEDLKKYDEEICNRWNNFEWILNTYWRLTFYTSNDVKYLLKNNNGIFKDDCLDEWEEELKDIIKNDFYYDGDIKNLLNDVYINNC